MNQPTNQQPGSIKIEMQQTLTLFVLEIRENVKCFPTKTGVIKCRHDIVCRDKDGNVSTFEHVLPQGAPVMFQVGVYQQVRCVFASEKGATVEPVIDGMHPSLIDRPAIKNNTSANNEKVGGACYTFAMGFAKDLFSAMVKRAEIDTQVSVQSIDLLLDIAERIQGELSLRLVSPMEQGNQYTAQIGGTSYLFALGFAKDVMVAEIAIRDLGSSISDDDIVRMFQIADKIQTNMTERFTF